MSDGGIASLQPLTALGGEGANLCYMSRPVGTEGEAEKYVKTKQGIQLATACVRLNVLVQYVHIVHVSYTYKCCIIPVYWCTSVAAVTCTCTFLVRLLLDLQDQHNTHSPQQYPGTVR